MTKNRSIKTVISESEWLVYKRILFPKHRRPPEKVSIWIEKIAQFGGFIKGKNRKPGILTLWDGWSKLNTMLKGIYAAGFAG